MANDNKSIGEKIYETTLTKVWPDLGMVIYMRACFPTPSIQMTTLSPS